MAPLLLYLLLSQPVGNFLILDFIFLARDAKLHPIFMALNLK
jgi:hypothetical protein